MIILGYWEALVETHRIARGFHTPLLTSKMRRMPDIMTLHFKYVVLENIRSLSRGPASNAQSIGMKAFLYLFLSFLDLCNEEDNCSDGTLITY